MSKKVYFAGKISKNDWRHTIVYENIDADTHRWFISLDEDYIDFPVVLNNTFEYCGPYFLGCDHGCYHGDNTHGVGCGKNYNSTCSGRGEGLSRSRVISKCYKWIDSSDIVFCWVDDITAYGTFTEIGYATAKNKPVYIACSSKIKEESMDIWFPLLSSTVFVYEDNVEKAWLNFTEWYNKGCKKKCDALYKSITHPQYRYILHLVENSKYELVEDISNCSSKTAGRLIGVLINSNKSPKDYGVDDILKLKVDN